MYIQGVHSSGFGDNVRNLIVYNPPMCCTSTLHLMFTQDLSTKCYHMLSHYQGQFLGIMYQIDNLNIGAAKAVGTSCGFDSVKIEWWNNDGLHLALDDRSQLPSLAGMTPNDSRESLTRNLIHKSMCVRRRMLN